MVRSAADPALGTLAQFHVLLFLYQTHPAAHLEQRRRPCLLNVDWEDILNTQLPLEEMMKRALYQLFTAEEMQNYRTYLLSTRSLINCPYPDPLWAEVKLVQRQPVTELRRKIIEKYVLPQPFLVQDFFMKLIKHWLMSSRTHEQPPQQLAARQQLAAGDSTSARATGPLQQVLFHLNFIDDRRTERTIKLDLEALSSELWLQLMDALKTRIFTREQLSHVEGQFGTCTNGSEVQWYVEFQVPAAYFNSVDVFHPTLRRQLFWSAGSVDVQYLFVAVRTPWYGEVSR